MRGQMSRREFLGMAGGTVALVGVPGCGIDLLPGQTAELLRSELPLPRMFIAPLPVPPVKQPIRAEAGADVYEVVQRVAEVEIVPGIRTQVFGYDGLFPGPTFETRRGRPVVVVHRNELAVPTVVHLHGGHSPAADDGWPLDLLLPTSGDGSRRQHGGSGDEQVVGSREYRYPMEQRAATLWYHDHRMDFTGPQVHRGLFGLHLVRDDVEDALPLPRGGREVPLIICDRSFAADGSFRYPSLDRTLQQLPGVEADWMEGVLGDVILVNGAPWPTMEIEAVRYRLRIVNASNARRYRLALEPEGPLVQIGSDGGLLSTPVVHTEIDIAPAERFDVVVDFSAFPDGADVRLVNRLGGGPTGQVMQFRVVRRGVDDSAVPDRLADVERFDPAQAVVRRRFDFTRGTVQGRGGWLVNGLPFDPDRPQVQLRLGELELWRFFTDLHHPVHVHLDSFQVVSRNGREPGPSDAGWKDTVDLRPAEYVDVAVRFTDHVGRFVMHCHNLEHEDMAMMAAFQTVQA